MTSPADSERVRAFKSRLPHAERRARILEVALEVFAAQGYDRTTTGAIAAAADIRRGVLYHYFPSKEALYVAVLGDQVERISQAVAEKMAAESDSRDRLVSAADAYLEFVERHPETWAVLLDESVLVDSEADAIRRRTNDAMIGAILALLADDIAKLEPDAQAAELHLNIVVAAFNAAIRWRQHHPDVSRPDVVASLRQLFVNLGRLAERQGSQVRRGSSRRS